MSARLTRRTLIGAALAPLVAGPATAGAAPRLVALDWSLGALAIDLGVAPVGLAEQALYRAWVSEPAPPAETAEVGLRTTPSFETLAALRPGLILINPLNAALRPRLERIAPTFSNTTFGPARAPLRLARDLTRTLAERLGRAPRGEALLAAGQDRLARVRDRLAGRPHRPLLVATLVDARHLALYGAGSLYGDALDAIGVANALTIDTGPWGSVIRGVADLGSLPPADLVVVAPVPPVATRALAEPGLLMALVAGRGGRVLRLPAAWPFGGVAEAARFAEALANALEGAA